MKVLTETATSKDWMDDDTEFKAWDRLSDESLSNFEVRLLETGEGK